MTERPNIPPELPPRQQRSGCATALGILVGLALLFPMACVLVIFPNQITRNDLINPIGLLLIGAAVAGIVLIAAAIRYSRSRS
ncbi:hypothetical protein [Bradyrhizobium sp. STM 3809]|uniref:hypothetical protein n=1 Tax=Bradyrhizobium sp. STM 3809 TaxID=551936 RepID=UPI000240605E|nr:hypothetical protein [Bradyrhizobium sp. STM 3809]CCD99544.1 conserved hypothetical protein [Bradyrhizobium sp. STM 3809]